MNLEDLKEEIRNIVDKALTNGLSETELNEAIDELAKRYERLKFFTVELLEVGADYIKQENLEAAFMACELALMIEQRIFYKRIFWDFLKRSKQNLEEKSYF